MADALFGLLGDIEFDLSTSPNGFRVSERSKFAEHPKIESTPTLQWTGDELNELNFTFRFAAHWCNPDERVRVLRSARLKHTAMRLVVGNNVFKGSYVIQEVRSEIRRTDGTGKLVWVDVEVNLKESDAVAAGASGSSGIGKSPFVLRR